jgi:serine/threonine protein kinase
MSTEPSELPTIVTDRYTIEKQIGAGGMATVYLARDSKHDREVALKVLRPELGAVLGADRFLAEIKITARLDHPHILTLIDSGAADGLLYYVLPYVRGESLRDLLNRETQLPIEDAIALTKQVGSALDYAHRHGVIHRDIKPENILIQEGEAILTDFGIALAVKEAGGSRLTQTGLSLGTPMYMSPEQATGEKTVGPKSDQYALAAVLYEMLTGEPPISGASSQAIIAKLLTEEPTRIRTIRKTVPLGVDEAVAKALSKSPADRFGTIGEFLRALDAAKSRTAADPVEIAAAPKKRNLVAIAGVAAALVAIAAIAGFAVKKSETPQAAPVTLRDRTKLTFSGSVLGPAISADGKQLAYFVRSCPTEKCTYAIAVQDVGSTQSRVILDGLSAAYSVEWSPDRRNLLFFGTHNGKLGIYVLSALGGQPQMIPGATSATFDASGDSLVVMDMDQKPDSDSAYTVKMTNLSGDVGDTWKVSGRGGAIFGAIAIPRTNLFLIGLERDRTYLWRVVDRNGTVKSEITHPCPCPITVSNDAIWMARNGTSAGSAIVRVAIDPATGKFGNQQDTVYSGRMTAFSVTADGSQFIVDDGVTEYDFAIGSVADMMARKIDGLRSIQSSSPLSIMVSPDGKRVLQKHTVPHGRGASTLRMSVAPFDGGPETALQADGRTLAALWADSVTVAMATLQDGGMNLSVMDVRTGRRQNQLRLTDSIYTGAAALPNGWVRVPPSMDRILIQAAGKTREVKKSAWHARIEGIAVSPNYSHVMYWGPNAATYDSVSYVVVPLDGGQPTHAFTAFAEQFNGGWLDDGSFIAHVYETLDAVTLTKIRLAGGTERLGTIPHVARELTHSVDFKRAALGWRSAKADAFMYQVVKQ